MKSKRSSLCLAHTTWLALCLWLCCLAASAAPMKNVILCIGDGMGPEQVKAGRYFTGAPLSFESLPYQASMTTHAANSGVTDSAAAATSLATGRKVNVGVISVALPGNTNDIVTSLELYKAQGKRVGLVTTTTMTHATPAGFGAHAQSRNYTTEIANDYLYQSRPYVLFGGGGSGMTVTGAQATGYVVVTNLGELLALNTETVTNVSGQFGLTQMPYEYDGLGALPHLSNMVTVALDILDNDPDGFFLMIEGGRIDHAGHANDITRSVRETAQFSGSVQVVLDWASNRTDTLIIVTADHETGGLTVTNDNGAGNAPGVTWSSTGHTATQVPVYAWGVNADMVSGGLDNTNIFQISMSRDVKAAKTDAALIVTPSTFSTTWSVSTGEVYRFERSLDVVTWTPFNTVTAATPSVIMLDSSIAGATQQFYRCVGQR